MECLLCYRVPTLPCILPAVVFPERLPENPCTAYLPSGQTKHAKVQKRKKTVSTTIGHQASGEIARLCHAACFWLSRRRSGPRRGVARSRMRAEAGKMPGSLVSPIGNSPACLMIDSGSMFLHWFSKRICMQRRCRESLVCMAPALRPLALLPFLLGRTLSRLAMQDGFLAFINIFKIC